MTKLEFLDSCDIDTLCCIMDRYFLCCKDNWYADVFSELKDDIQFQKRIRGLLIHYIIEEVDEEELRSDGYITN